MDHGKGEQCKRDEDWQRPRQEGRRGAGGVGGGDETRIEAGSRYPQEQLTSKLLTGRRMKVEMISSDLTLHRERAPAREVLKQLRVSEGRDRTIYV